MDNFQCYNPKDRGNGLLSAIILSHSTDQTNGCYLLKVTWPALVISGLLTFLHGANEYDFF
jgi:hypothetical protein